MGSRRDSNHARLQKRVREALQYFQVQQAPVGADITENEGEGLRQVPHHVQGQMAESPQGLQEAQAPAETRHAQARIL